MKTTVHIPDILMKEARKLAQKKHTTLKSLIEEGLRRVISGHKQRGKFILRKATFRGKGLQPHLDDAEWDRPRDLGYQGRGA